MPHVSGRHAIFSLFVCGMLVLPAAVSAQSRPCAGDEYRQFDFWVGGWRVENAAGALVGHDTIRRVTDCFLHERRPAATRDRASTYSTPPVECGTRVGSTTEGSCSRVGGLLLQLDGGLDGGKMILQGPGVGQGGAAVINRITWSVEGGDPDHVRQLWETSADDGKTWSVGFDGHYMREAEKN